MSGSEPFEAVRQALIARTGHSYYADKDRLLADRLRERLAALKLDSLERYLELLTDGERGEREWRALEDATTIGETYFFRYADHFESLRQTILPNLINGRQNDRALRVWSIGCSNGAEPYSVAILLRELLGDEIDQWRMVITGGDISERALASARSALFGNWALRTVAEADRARYFDRVDPRTWRLKAQFRAMVRFERQNILELLTSAAPLQWNAFDLILCRNVLIYFSPEKALALIAALRNRLASGGALLLGHAEATLIGEPPFVAPLGPQAPLPTEFRQALTPFPAEFTAGPPIPPPLPKAPVITAQVSAPAATSTLDALREAADAGEYERAEAVYQALVASDPLDPKVHYYGAILHLVSDELESAEKGMRRALYLDRTFVMAHHRLGLLLVSRGRIQEGQRALLSALALAAGLPSDQPLAEGDGITAGAFVEASKQLAILSGAAA